MKFFVLVHFTSLPFKCSWNNLALWWSKNYGSLRPWILYMHRRQTRIDLPQVPMLQYGQAINLISGEENVWSKLIGDPYPGWMSCLACGCMDWELNSPVPKCPSPHAAHHMHPGLPALIVLWLYKLTWTADLRSSPQKCVEVHTSAGMHSTVIYI